MSFNGSRRSYLRVKSAKSNKWECQMTMGNYFPRINSNIIGFKTPSNNKHSESGMLLRTSVDENYKRGMPVVESAVVNVLISSDT
jgi:hypothetical protein